MSHDKMNEKYKVKEEKWEIQVSKVGKNKSNENVESFEVRITINLKDDEKKKKQVVVSGEMKFTFSN